MKKITLFLFLITAIRISAQNNDSIMVFKNEEIKIPFPDSFQEADDKIFYSIIDDNYKGGYFNEVIKKIRYYEDYQQKYYETGNGDIISTQHAVSNDGYLSSMYVYPAKDKKQVIPEVEKAFKPRICANYTRRETKELRINDKTVLNWFVQCGKTRLEHYMLIGKKYNYLFISTPYGEKDYIEDILKQVTFIDGE